MMVRTSRRPARCFRGMRWHSRLSYCISWIIGQQAGAGAGGRKTASGPPGHGGWHAPHWSALPLAIGADAILQVIIELSAFLTRSSGGPVRGLMTPAVLSGAATGLAFMHVTAKSKEVTPGDGQKREKVRELSFKAINVTHCGHRRDGSVWCW